MLKMAISESESFTFTWRIENFSMCPQQCDEYIASPTFVVDFLQKTAWQLQVYPRGNKETNYVSCCLKRTTVGSYLQDITIRSELSLLSVNFGKDVKFDSTIGTFKTEKCLGYPQFCSLKEIFRNESGLLPNDILTVQCVLRSSAEKLKSTELFSMSTERWDSNNPSKNTQCSSRTRIKVTTKSFLWPIKRFYDLPHNKKLSKTIESAMEDVPKFDLTFSWNQETETDPCACIEMRRNISNGNMRGTEPAHHSRGRIAVYSSNGEKSFFVRCHIRTVGAPKICQYQAEDEHFFQGTDDVWRFPTFINTKELMQKEYFTYTDDILYLQFDFSFSFPGNELNIENIDESCSVYCGGAEKPNARKCKNEKLFRNGKFSDLTLRVEDREFKVHRNILGTESDVFCAMFESHMREHRDGFVDITDLEPDTVERFLRFLYTDTLEALNAEEAIKLYPAADKYNVVYLKHLCRNILISHLSVSAVCEVLILADKHSDDDLLEAVKNFIQKNANDIFHSEQWKKFAETPSQLATSTMLYVLTNKFLF